jgi:hypothetical protein
MEANALTPLFTFTLKVEKIQWCRKQWSISYKFHCSGYWELFTT